MFSREKIKKFLKENPDSLAKSKNVNKYFKVITNSNIGNEQSVHKQSLKKFFAVEDVENVEALPENRYISDDDNSRIVARTLSLRHTKTPLENILMQENNFSVIKPNKNYAAEESDNEKKKGEVNNSIEDTFHRAVSPIFFMAQCFAIMPVMGILNPNPKRLRFSYKSSQVILTLIFMCSSSVIALSMLKFLVKIGINAKNFVGLVFFSCVQCSTVLFVSLAQRWPNIMRYWARIESIFTQKPYEMSKRSLASRVRVAACIIIICSAVEHALYLSSAVLSYKRAIELCAPMRNYTEKVSFEDFVQRNYDYVFTVLSYNKFVGVFILIFCWLTFPYCYEFRNAFCLF